MTIPTAGSRELRLAALADELRADAATGLHYDPDADDAKRLRRLRALAAQLLSHVDKRDAVDIEAVFTQDTGPRTPLVAVVLLLNHQRDGLLFVRDGDTAGVPYAYVDPDLDHETAVNHLAAKLTPEERLIPVPHGICDSVSAGLAVPHTYFLTYVVDVTLLDRSAIDAEVVPEARLPEAERDPLTRFITGGAQRDVLEAPFALDDATAELVAEVERVAVEGAATADRHNAERYERLRVTTRALLDGVRNAAAFEPVDFGYLDARTPNTCADMLILDDENRILLMRRHDNGKWAMPGGACEVGETSAASAVREALEEVELEVTVAGLAGVFDHRLIVDSPVQVHTCFVYVGHPAEPGARPSITAEAVEVGWFALDDLDGLDELWEPHRVKISGALQTVPE